MSITYDPAGADPGFLKGGGHIMSTSKKGGQTGGPILGPMLKSLHRGTKGGGANPPGPLDPPLPWLLLRGQPLINQLKAALYIEVIISVSPVQLIAPVLL